MAPSGLLQSRPMQLLAFFLATQITGEDPDLFLHGMLDTLEAPRLPMRQPISVYAEVAAPEDQAGLPGSVELVLVGEHTGRMSLHRGEPIFPFVEAGRRPVLRFQSGPYEVEFAVAGRYALLLLGDGELLGTREIIVRVVPDAEASE